MINYLPFHDKSGWTELGGAEGAQAPPSFLDLYSKNFKISKIRDENFFFYLVVPPHKKFASVHPECVTRINSQMCIGLGVKRFWKKN